MATSTTNPASQAREPENRLMRAIIGAANPLVRGLLGSPLHRPLSGALLLLRVRGRKTGRLISTPVGYTRDGGRILVVTSASYRWWRNVATGADVEVRAAGEWLAGRARVLEPGSREHIDTVERFVELRGPKAAIQFGLLPPTEKTRVMIPDPRLVVIEELRAIDRPAA